MCTIDPLMCYYNDHLDYWQKHPEELELAEEVMKAGFRGCAVFVNNYVTMAQRLERLTK